MKLSLLLAALALFLNPLLLAAQNSAEKEVEKSSFMWFDYNETIRFNKKWTLQAELSERFLMDPVRQFQAMCRLHGLYNAGENWTLGAAFSAWMIKQGDVTTYELRPAQVIICKQKFEKAKNLALSHRYVMEERLNRKVANGELAEGYAFTMRFRYRFWADYTVAKIGEKKNPLKVIVSDEIFLQAGESIVYNTFQQNRFYTGISCRVIDGFSVAVGYMNQFAQLKSGSRYEVVHIPRISFLHELHLAKKD